MLPGICMECNLPPTCSPWKANSSLENNFSNLFELTREDQAWPPKDSICALDFQVSFGMWELSLAQTEGRDVTGLPVGQPCSESLSPNLEVEGKSVFLKLHCTELLLFHIIVVVPLCSWNINWLYYFSGYWGKFCPLPSNSASPKSIVDLMCSGFVIVLHSCTLNFAWMGRAAGWEWMERLGTMSSSRDMVLNQSWMTLHESHGEGCLYRGGWQQRLVYSLMDLMGANY